MNKLPVLISLLLASLAITVNGQVNNKVSQKSNGAVGGTVTTQADIVIKEMMQSETDATISILKERNTGEIGLDNPSLERLARSYIRAGDFHQSTEYVLKQALREIKTEELNQRPGSQLAASNARLQCLQVAQNGRIIQLLEYIAARLPQEKTVK